MSYRADDHIDAGKYFSSLRPDWEPDDGIEECPECESEMVYEDTPEDWWDALCLNCSTEVAMCEVGRLRRKLRERGVDPETI